MSTKDTLMSVGLLAAGGVAIAAASGAYGKGSRAKAGNRNDMDWWTGVRVNFATSSGSDLDTVSTALGSLIGLRAALIRKGSSRAEDVRIEGFTQSPKSPYAVRMNYHRMNDNGEPVGKSLSIAMDLIDYINVF